MEWAAGTTFPISVDVALDLSHPKSTWVRPLGERRTSLAHPFISDAFMVVSQNLSQSRCESGPGSYPSRVGIQMGRKVTTPSAGFQTTQQDLQNRLAPLPRHQEASPSHTSTWTLTWPLLAEVAGQFGSGGHQPPINLGSLF